MNVAQAVQRGVALGLERLDAQLLVLYVLGQAAHDRAWLLAHDTDALPPQAVSMLETLAARRVAGEPLAYLTGHKEFYGLDLVV
ncbi:MAG TPA: peptide chain release factor N(5)-glutamine methyltransferase, partial [Rhodoferax sp.]|nr:peptide chain release factor N(5)-glutamine methyltransferase [Rhodoferax sp.]